jgi:hypothetical protein
MRENLHTPGRAGTGYADPDYDLALDCLFPGDFEDFDPGPGFHISLKDQRLRVTLCARCVNAQNPAHLIVIRAQDLAGLRVD